MKIRTLVATIGLLTAFLAACRKQDAVYQQFVDAARKNYLGKVDSITVFPGKQRVKLKWKNPLDRKVERVRILWNNRTDSLDVAVDNAERWSEAIVPSLTEGLHTFVLVSLDAAGNSSINLSAEGRAYGPVYESELRPRTIRTKSYDVGTVTLSWVPAAAVSIGGELYYQTNGGVQKRIEVASDATSTELPDFKSGSTVRHRAFYFPEPGIIDTLFSPFHEETIDLLYYEGMELAKSKFSVYPLPGDPLPWNASGNTLSSLWSGIRAGSQQDKAWFRTENGSGIPHHFQFDLGVVTTLKALRFWQRGTINEHSLVYANGNLKRYEIWGSTAPAADGSYDGWVKLLTCTSIKPSGLPRGQNSAEDLSYAAQGEYYEFPAGIPSVRFLRVKVLETWAGTDFMHMSEISLWGDYWGL